MFKQFWAWIKGEKMDQNLDFGPIISKSEINEELKKKIMHLETTAEELCIKYQAIYKDPFEKKGKRNLQLWTARDIDGDESNQLTSSQCLEAEYRSLIAIDYEGEPKLDEGFYRCTIELWYYYQGFSHNSGTGHLYISSVNQLEEEITETLELLLNES
ncbi:hypothetical protein SAMN04488168_11536 [Bacillus sp. 491mf]|uniref:hypothetical protein n=1 Tax=unclassified Bacillus (in: firmicutes) TaxID=185979 RepID=UPI00054FD86F|nr:MULTISPECIES: hypothetical protein [unclassified Bacillus (in: firmicutes)]SFD03101.1 hypothetical protein SAMN04488168_11536 [Bacillus sp. 491mf]